MIEPDPSLFEKPLAPPCPECDPDFVDHNGDEDD